MDVIVWLLDLQLPMQTVPITTNVMSSNLAQAIQQYVIKFASDLDEICDTVNGEVSVSYINHFNVQNMRQTIKLTPLFCNLVGVLVIHSYFVDSFFQ